MRLYVWSVNICLASSKSHKWLVGQGVKTLPSHGRIMGSIPVRAASKRQETVSFLLRVSNEPCEQKNRPGRVSLLTRGPVCFFAHTANAATASDRRSRACRHGSNPLSRCRRMPRQRVTAGHEPVGMAQVLYSDAGECRDSE